MRISNPGKIFDHRTVKTLINHEDLPCGSLQALYYKSYMKPDVANLFFVCSCFRTFDVFLLNVQVRSEHIIDNNSLFVNYNVKSIISLLQLFT